MKKKIIPAKNIEAVSTVAQERIQELKEQGSFQMDAEAIGQWSPSKYKTLDKCPLKFLLEYILKVRVQEESVDDNTVLRHVGSAAHTILEYTRAGHSIDESFAKAKEQHFNDVTLEHWDKVENLKDSIKEFEHRINVFGIQNPVENQYIEKSLAVDKDWNPVPFFSPKAYFRGIVDLSLMLENGDAVIIDHKHGGSAQFGLRNHQDQLDSYKVLVHFALKEVSGAAAGIHFVKEGDVLIGQRSSKAQIEEDITKRLDFYIRSAVDYVAEKGLFRQERNSLCKYCDYQPICHGGKRGTANKLEDVVQLSQELL